MEPEVDDVSLKRLKSMVRGLFGQADVSFVAETCFEKHKCLGSKVRGRTQGAGLWI